MMKKYSTSLFIFRRDLRLEDNTGLIEALRSSEKVIPCFIFDPRQVEKNDYKSDNCLQFMLESLEDLDSQLKTKGGRLYFFCGKPDQVIGRIISSEKAEAVFVNRDYTPFSIHRDLAIEDACRKSRIAFHSSGDSLLHEPEEISKGDGGVYTVFTPFFRKASTLDVRPSAANRFNNYYDKPVAAEKKEAVRDVLTKRNPFLAVRGGRSAARKILNSIVSFKNYDATRNIPSLDKTTHLSAHHKFGTVSIREVYHSVREKFGKDHALIREIFWRDFFVHVGFHHPAVLGEAFNRKYDKIQWDNDPKKFKAWCDGLTGFPIVDAGMRELNATGFMHNRVRMIVASFLVKDLHIDWRWGEKYFAQKLADYDPFVNNGNWQWAASTGCDAQPYFRIFNPWLQQQRFDPECLYIKKWVPEFKSAEYPAPIVDHKTQSSLAIKMYRGL